MALADNLVAHWKLEEVSGSRADSVGANTLTDVNTVTQAVGKQGSCASFTAASLEALTCADNAAVSTGNVDWTFACWFFTGTFASFGCLASKGWTAAGTVNAEWILYVDTSASNKPFFGVCSGTTTGGVQSTVACVISTWYYVAVWHDSVNDRIGISVNGTATTATHAPGINDGTLSFKLGADEVSHGLYWGGRIDEASLWKRVVDSVDLATLYNAGAGLAFPWPAAAAQPSHHYYQMMSQ